MPFQDMAILPPQHMIMLAHTVFDSQLIYWKLYCHVFLCGLNAWCAITTVFISPVINFMIQEGATKLSQWGLDDSSKIQFSLSFSFLYNIFDVKMLKISTKLSKWGLISGKVSICEMFSMIHFHFTVTTVYA